MLFTSWKHLYSELASQATTIKANAPFAEFLDSEDLPESCKRTLAAATSEHCATLMAYSTRKTAKIVHHFRVDVKTPLNPERSGEAWALIGNGVTASPVGIPASIWDAVEGLTPPFEELCGVTSPDDFTNLRAPSTEDLQADPSLKFEGKRMVVLPPFLTKVLMETDSDCAITLMIAACKAICDFDSVAADVGSEEGDEEGDAMTAKNKFFHVVQFLYLIGKGVLTGRAVDVLSTSRASTWAASVTADCCVGMPPARATGEVSSQDFRSLTSGVSQLTAAVTRSNDAAEAKATSSTKKKGKDDMQEFTVKMIINASEDVPEGTMDDDGDILVERTDFVPTYKKLLECSTSGKVKQHLDHYLNKMKKCSANIPLSTCVAIQLGKLLWADTNHPEPFSLLAMFHLAASATSTRLVSGIDEVSLHLKSVEGLGLSDADIAKATKLMLVAPTDINMLAKMLGVFTCVTGAIFGETAPLTKAMGDWVDHMTMKETAYINATAANPAFPLQLGCFIDRRVQMYLEDCQDAASPDEVSETHLSFVGTKQQIIDGTFPKDTQVPEILASQLRTIQSGRRPRGGPRLGSGDISSGSDDDAREQRRKPRRKRADRGNAVSNPRFQEILRVPTAMIGFVVSRLVRAGIKWGKRKICVHYHSEGICHDNCPFSNSHMDMPEPVHTKYCKFIKKTKKDYRLQNTAADSDDDDDAAPASANKKAKADGGTSD